MPLLKQAERALSHTCHAFASWSFPSKAFIPTEIVVPRSQRRSWRLSTASCRAERKKTWNSGQAWPGSALTRRGFMCVVCVGVCVSVCMCKDGLYYCHSPAPSMTMSNSKTVAGKTTALLAGRVHCRRSPSKPSNRTKENTFLLLLLCRAITHMQKQDKDEHRAL